MVNAKKRKTTSDNTESRQGGSTNYQSISFIISTCGTLQLAGYLSHKNLLNDLAHHESPIAWWLERATGIWKVVGLTHVWGSENSFSG